MGSSGINRVHGETPNNTSPNRQPTFTTTVTMGRLHSNGKGISASAIPYSRTPPSWLKTTPEQVVDQICKLARKGATPSQIGVVLRDSHGVAQVKVVTGNKILRILKSNGLAPEVPEDLYVDQEGRRCPQAPRAQPKGQGLQIPPYSHRVHNPPSQQILQDCRCSATQLEVRERHCKHHGRIKLLSYYPESDTGPLKNAVWPTDHGDWGGE